MCCPGSPIVPVGTGESRQEEGRECFAGLGVASLDILSAGNRVDEDSAGEIGRHITSVCEVGDLMAQLDGGREALCVATPTFTSPIEEGTRGSAGDLEFRDSPAEEGTRRTSLREDGNRRSPSASSGDTLYSLDTKGLSRTSMGDGLVGCTSSDEGGRDATPMWPAGSRRTSVSGVTWARASVGESVTKARPLSGYCRMTAATFPPAIICNSESDSDSDTPES